MDRKELEKLNALLESGDIDKAKEIVAEQLEEDRESYMEDCAARDYEFYAHGVDYGTSEYDLDPGVCYNDAGEPMGYM